MIRALAGLLSVAALFCSFAPAQPPPKEMTFPSGLKIKILSIQEIEIKEEGAGCRQTDLLLQYRTRRKPEETASLQKEVDEIWNWLRRDAERRKLTRASIEPVDSAQTPIGGYVFKKQSDGSWKTKTHGIDHLAK